MTGRWRRARPWGLALAGYALMALLCTWPLVAHLSTVIPHDPGDPLLNTWILWWNAHATPLTSQWWNAPMFWPLTGALALSEHLLGLSLVATPLQWLGAEPVTAYNVLFLLSFPLCALSAHALAYDVTARHDASAIAGVAFGFNPYRISQLSHLQMLWVFWMPLALLALHRYARDGRPRWLLMFAAMWVGQALSNTYFLLFFPLLLVLWIVWFLTTPLRPMRLGAVAVAWGCGALALLPIVIPYYHMSQRFALERTYEEIRTFSAGVGALASASPLVSASAFLPAVGNSEQQLFPGVTTLCLIIVAAAASAWRTGIEPWPRPRLTAVLALITVGAIAMAMAAPLVGPWHLDIGRLRVVSVTTATKPLTVAIWSGVLIMATGARAARAWTTRSAFAFYVLAAAVMYAFSFGPEPALFGVPFWYRPPYAWLMELPGFSNVRAPARFAMLAVLCLSVAGAIAFARITALLTRPFAVTVAVLALATVTADGWIRRLPLLPLPPRLSSLETTRDGAVVELPIGDAYDDIAAMYRSTYHGRPVVNGYSGFVPVHYLILKHALEVHEPDALEAMRVDGPLTVVEAMRAVTIPRLDPAVSVPAGQPLRIHSATVEGVSIDLPAISDGNRFSRWHSEAVQRGIETVTIDLGSVQRIEGVVLSLGTYLYDYPQSLAIETSEDLRVWTMQWSGRGAGKAVAGAIRDPLMVPLTFGFAPTRARWIRLRQLGIDLRFYWSIAELRVYGR